MKWEKIRETMEQTCFNSLSFCCGLNKPCPVRDKVLKELKISDGNYKEFKKRCDLVLKSMLKDGDVNEMDENKQ